MSTTAVQQAFEEFERSKVRVPDKENQQAKQAHAALRAALQETLGELHVETFLAGSYSRRTQAVHLKDLDIILVLRDFSGKLRASASETLALVKRTADSLSMVSNGTTKCRAIECELVGYTFWADLVPALDDGVGGLILPYVDRDEGIDEWRPADPKGQTRACQAKNAETDGAYVPVTRIVKFWNQSFTSSPSQEKPLPSYLAEAILFDALSGPMDWAKAVSAFFENAHKHLSLPNPSVPCPGNMSDYVDQKLADGRRLRALAYIDAALPSVQVAAAETDPAKALEAWGDVFGPSFPAPSQRDQTIGKALRDRAARVSGTGVTASPVMGRRPIPARPHSHDWPKS